MALMPINHRVKIEERPRVLLDSGYEIIEEKAMNNLAVIIPVVASKEI